MNLLITKGVSARQSSDFHSKEACRRLQLNAKDSRSLNLKEHPHLWLAKVAVLGASTVCIIPVQTRHGNWYAFVARCGENFT